MILLLGFIAFCVFIYITSEKKPQWKRFDEELPTTVPEAQVNILFCRPKWAAYRRGMYTHKIGEGLSECLSEYDIDNDKYYAWDGEDRHIPTHWMKSPEILEK